MMPGGQKEAYDLVAPIFEQIAAKAPQDGKPCVAYMGANRCWSITLKWFTTELSTAICN